MSGSTHRLLLGSELEVKITGETSWGPNIKLQTWFYPFKLGLFRYTNILKESES